MPRYGFVDSRAIAALLLRGSRVVAARLPHKPHSAYPRAVYYYYLARSFLGWRKKNEAEVLLVDSTVDSVEVQMEHHRRSTWSITDGPRGASPAIHMEHRRRSTWSMLSERDHIAVQLALGYAGEVRDHCRENACSR